MSSRDWRLRVKDILNAISSIQESTANMTFEEFLAEEIIVKAVLYDFIVMGEAARNIPTRVQARYPQIAWLPMRDMRNVMTHEYFQVDLEIVWDSILDTLAVNCWRNLTGDSCLAGCQLDRTALTELSPSHHLHKHFVQVYLAARYALPPTLHDIELL